MEVDEKDGKGEEIIIKSEPFDFVASSSSSTTVYQDNNNQQLNFNNKNSCLLCKSHLKSKHGVTNLNLPATCFSCGNGNDESNTDNKRSRTRSLRSTITNNRNNNTSTTTTTKTIAINKFELASVIWNEFNLSSLPPTNNVIFPFCAPCSIRLGEFYLVLQQLQGLEEKLTNLRHELMQEFEQPQQQQRDANEDQDPLSTFNDGNDEDDAADPDLPDNNFDNDRQDEAMIRNNENSSSSDDTDDDEEWTPTHDPTPPLELKIKRSKVSAKPSLKLKLKNPKNIKSSSKVTKKNTNNKSASQPQLVYTCSICERTFNKRPNYDRHMLVHNPTSASTSSLTRNGKKKKKRHAPCPTCHQIFSCRKQQLVHSILIHGDKSAGKIVRKATAEPEASTSSPKELTRADLIDHAIGEELSIAAIASNSSISVLHDCGHCGRTFDRYQTYQAHLELHKEVVVRSDDGGPKKKRRKPTSCTECGQTFPSRHEALKHAMKEHGILLVEDASKSKKGKGEAKPICEICGQIYSNNTHLRKHLQSIHQKIENYPCPTCPLKFCTKQSLYWHTVNEHGATKKYTCAHCPERFNTGLVKRKHLATVHPDQLPYLEWVCRVCWRAEYESSDALAAHKESAHGNFKCHICGKYEITRYKLKSHMLVHTKEKPHSCTLCGNLFTRKENVRVHMRQVHSVNLVEYDGPLLLL